MLASHASMGQHSIYHCESHYDVLGWRKGPQILKSVVAQNREYHPLNSKISAFHALP